MTKIPLHTIEWDEGIENRATFGNEAGGYVWKPKRHIAKGARKILYIQPRGEDERRNLEEAPGASVTGDRDISQGEPIKPSQVLTRIVPFHRGIVYDTLVAYREIRFPHIKKVPDILSHIIEVSGSGKELQIRSSQSDLSDFLDLEVCVYKCIELGNEDFETMKPVYEGKLSGIYDPLSVEMDEYLRPQFRGVTHVLHFPQTYGQKIAQTKAKILSDVRGILTQADTHRKRRSILEISSCQILHQNPTSMPGMLHRIGHWRSQKI